MANFQPVRIAYNTHEPASGTDEGLAPIIYLHGATSYKEAWGEIPQIVANATKRKSYSLDARNHGDSEWSDDFDFDVNMDDLIHLMDTLKIEKAILVGHSMGGITAIKAALTKPERVEKIVVEDMSLRSLRKEITDVITTFMTILLEALEKAPHELDEDAVKTFVLKYFMEKVPEHLKKSLEKADLEKRKKLMALQRGADGRFSLKCNLPRIVKALTNPEKLASKPEGQFEGPAKFIYGKLSFFQVGADEDYIKQFFPNAELEGIEGAEHDVHVSKPSEFTDALLKFLS